MASYGLVYLYPTVNGRKIINNLELSIENNKSWFSFGMDSLNSYDIYRWGEIVSVGIIVGNISEEIIIFPEASWKVIEAKSSLSEAATIKIEFERR